LAYCPLALLLQIQTGQTVDLTADSQVPFIGNVFPVNAQRLLEEYQIDQAPQLRLQRWPNIEVSTVPEGEQWTTTFHFRQFSGSTLGNPPGTALLHDQIVFSLYVPKEITDGNLTVLPWGA